MNQPSNIPGEYAVAVFQIAKEAKKVSSYKKAALLVVAEIKKNRDIVSVWNNQAISLPVRESLIRKAFQGLEPHLLNFLIIMAKKRQFNLVCKVLEKLIQKINKSLNVSEGVIYSVDVLKNEKLLKVQKRASEILKTKVSLSNVVDKSLVSGFKIVVNDKTIEDSLATRVKNIKNQLLLNSNLKEKA